MKTRTRGAKTVARGDEEPVVASPQEAEHEVNKRKLGKGISIESIKAETVSPSTSPKKKKRKKAGADTDDPPEETSSEWAVEPSSPEPGPSQQAVPSRKPQSKAVYDKANRVRAAKKPGYAVVKNVVTDLQGMKIVTSMSCDDLQEFLSRMESESPIDDTKRVPERENMIDWEKVSFSCYGPLQCKLAWLYLSNQTRKFRVVHELVSEIKMKLNMDYKKLMRKMIESSPDFPVKPYAMGAFQLYCKELWDKHKDKLQKTNGKAVNFFDFQKKCYETWGVLSDNDKKDYDERVKLIAAEYKRKTKEFYAQYPLFAPGMAKLNKDGQKEKPISLHRLRANQKIANEVYNDAPPLPLTPFKLFINSKLNRLDPPPSQDELPDLKKHYVGKWKAMSEKKKLRWVESCIRKCERYVDDVKEYKKSNPGYMLPINFQISKLISREEFKVWAFAHGNPPTPKQTTFDFYLQAFTSTDEAAGIEDPDELRKAAMKKFEELDWYTKEMYKMKFRMHKVEYKKELLEYFNNLPVILRRIALDCISKTNRKVLEEEIDKEPLVFDDEQPEPVGEIGIPEDDTEVSPKKKRKKTESDGGDGDTESQMEVDETVEDHSPNKKKKKKKKRKKQAEAEEDEQTVIDVEPVNNETELMEEQKQSSKSKKARNTLQQNTKDDINATSESEDESRDKTTVKRTVIQPKATKFFPGKTITPLIVRETIRGILDAKQHWGRAFSVYYFYAKYVSMEKAWNDMLAKHGIVETAGRIVETFNRLEINQKEVFLSQALDFHKRRYYGCKILTNEDLYVPNLTFFPNEPKAPPRDAVRLYLDEMEIKVQHNRDLKFVPWTKLDEKTQMYYLKKLHKITQEYVNQYEKFVKNMTPNDLVEYVVTKREQWEKDFNKKAKARKKQFEDSVQAAANDFVVPFSRATYAAELSDDGHEPDPLLHESAKPNKMRYRSFRYKKNPFSTISSRAYKECKNILVHKLCESDGTPDPDSDLPSSSDEEDFSLHCSVYRQKLSISKRRIERKVKEMAKYYYPLEDLYEDAILPRNRASALEDAKKKYLEKSNYILENELHLTRTNGRFSKPLAQAMKSMNVVSPNSRIKSVRKSLITLRSAKPTASQLECGYCDFKGATVEDLLNHRKSHKSEKNTFHCDRCKYSTTSCDAFKRHLWDHKWRFTFRCADCPIASVNKHYFNNHLKRLNHSPVPESKIELLKGRKKGPRSLRSQVLKAMRDNQISAIVPERIATTTKKKKKAVVKFTRKRKEPTGTTIESDTGKDADNSEIIVEATDYRPTFKLVTASPPKKKLVGDFASTSHRSSSLETTDFVTSDENVVRDLLDREQDISPEEADLFAAALHFTDEDILEAESSLK
ncbi:unnamed protein product [Orchesella dallaii]|uniref:HMG box domain-containing protein n=1 Tax=Orchesella dallaii TaxID=48710 RepID=A0ABP1S6B2_9HEXA